MSIRPRSTAGVVAGALAVAGLALPVAAGPAAAACRAGIQYTVTSHHPQGMPVAGTKFTTSVVGKHAIVITKATTLSAKYVGVTTATDRGYLLATVQETMPGLRNRVAVTKGHRTVYEVVRGSTVTVVYGSTGEWVGFKKYDVTADCHSTFVGTGRAVFPRNNLHWEFIAVK